MEKMRSGGSGFTEKGSGRNRGRLLSILAAVLLAAGVRLVRDALPWRTRIDEAEGNILVSRTTYTEAQGINQCGGCSAAYLLRTDGIDITGAEAYDQLPWKLPNGYVLPHGIVRLLEQQGYEAEIISGTPGQLAAYLVLDRPVIALINEGAALHYVAVVGLQDGELLLADSLCPVGEGANRRVPLDEFGELMETGIPFFEGAYIIAYPREE